MKPGNKLEEGFRVYAKKADDATDRFLDFMKKNIVWIAAVLVVILSAFVRWSFRGYVSGDMKNALQPWTVFLRENGGFFALKYYPHFTPKACDYPVAYIELLALLSYLPCDEVTAIKLSSFFFDYLLAAGGYFLAKEITGKKSCGVVALCAVCLMPTGILNSAVWGQCDQLYACGAAWSLYFAIRGRRNLSAFVIGLAFANKPQAVFFLPVLAWLFLAKKMRVRNLLMIAAGYLITFLPAYCFGTPFAEPFAMFFTQLGKYPNANYGAANIYAFLQFKNVYDYLNNGAAVLFAAAVVGSVLAMLFRKDFSPSPVNCMLVTALFAVLMPYVLPHMHERYFFLADVTVILYAIISGRRYFLIPMMQFSSLLCYTHFLFGGYIITSLGEGCVQLAAVINTVVLCFLLYDLKERMTKKPDHS